MVLRSPHRTKYSSFGYYTRMDNARVLVLRSAQSQDFPHLVTNNQEVATRDSLLDTVHELDNLDNLLRNHMRTVMPTPDHN